MTRPPSDRSIPSRPEVHRGNGLGLLLAGIALLAVIGALLTPWWGCAFVYQGDRIRLDLSAGTTYVQTCTGGNCTTYQQSYTYSSTGLTQSGRVLGDLGAALGLTLVLGTASFLAAMITWVDRARLGAVRTTMAVAAAAGALSAATPIWASTVLPGAVAANLAPVAGAQDLGPLGGWVLAIVAACLFFASAVSEWTTLRYAKPWDAPLSTDPTPPSEEGPPVSTPPDRVQRLELLRQRGAITDEDFAEQRARILSVDRMVGPIPIPPNSGSRRAAQAHLDYLRESGRYRPDQLAAQTEVVLRAYGLSPDLLFPEEEIQALAVRFRAGKVTSAEFERRKKEILGRI